MNNFNPQMDAQSNLIWIYDAVHGAIDIRDGNGSKDSTVIIKLLSSPMMERLRRIKQLGYVSQSYIAADHSRYAHALGTMHVMRMILKRLTTGNGFSPKLFEDLNSCFPEMFSGDSGADYNILTQHMLVAALLQDVGELPYNFASCHIYKPSFELKQEVSNSVGLNVNRWKDKEIFTVASLYNAQHAGLLTGLHLPFLVFLITGSLPSGQLRGEGLTQLVHIMDGAVDADRLDYVYRDAHHTVGGLGTPGAVIDSLLYYDEMGPVFSDPGPVSNFLVTRAYLYSTIYLSPANRFRILLLVNLLQGISRKEECAREFFQGEAKGELAFEDFLELDDISIATRIKQFDSGNTKRRLDRNTQDALNILMGRETSYECLWLPPAETVDSDSKKINLPNGLFFDTFLDQNRPLYDPGSVRVEADRFRMFEAPIPLEECGGPFVAIFKASPSILPMPNSILLFTPKKKLGEGWKEFQQALTNGWLYNVLVENDPFGPIDFPSDTRRFNGFIGPDIFISFTWKDISIVRRVVKTLYRKRRRYYLLINPSDGIGNSPSRNSTGAVEAAECVLIIASSNYVTRFLENIEGNIGQEIFAMSNRHSSEGLQIFSLSIDDYREIRQLPWKQFGYNEPPYVGKALREANDYELDNAVDEILGVIGRKFNE